VKRLLWQTYQLTTEEKIQMMEFLWDSLCSQADNISSPPWHADILQERENELNSGEDTFIDWNKSKKNIRNHLG
jgi:putative addiction module component (TIGR02574 family)